MFACSSACSQQIRIARVQPDAMATGMTMTMEILAPAADTGMFGTDGIYLPATRLEYINTADSIHVIFGPVCVSWHGRLMQVPVMAPRIAGTSSLGTIQFVVIVGNRKSPVQEISLVQPQTSLTVVGSGVLGDGMLGTLTAGNTLVVDSLVIAGQDSHSPGLFTFDTQDPDDSGANPRYHPMTVLALHAVRVTNAQLSVSANALNGGPGGGGGGGGFASTGGAGYTGGGSDSAYDPANAGSGTGSTPTFGGASTTGVLGGATSGFASNNADQGGGGGTGHPFGSSGVFSGGNDTSQLGGFGGASAGGEAIDDIPYGGVYGGGGGGFSTDGTTGEGSGQNQGHSYGGRFLVPMMGGSGGGAGNAKEGSQEKAGSGGGGGGALTIVSFGDITVTNASVTARGASGTAGVLRQEAGGGGGSGGAVYLASRNGIKLSEGLIVTDGGSGGAGGKNGDTVAGAGGHGGLGRIRFDGNYNDTCSACRFSGAMSAGPIIIPADSQLHGPTNLIGGVSGSRTDLLDSIRIYYRNHHSPWQYIDTLRDTTGTQPPWRARLGVGHDSLLFVVVYEKVKQPHAASVDAEPEWLSGHLASAAVRVVPTPHPVAHTDTLDFGCIRMDDSTEAPIFVTNLGESPFVVTNITISDPTHFIVVRDTSRFDGYVTDSLIVRYVPHTGPRKDTATLRIMSATDTVVVVLIGCSIDKDERLKLEFSGLNFHRVHVGECPSATMKVTSIGKDPILVHCKDLVHPPFRVVNPTNDTLLLTPNAFVTLTIEFCPTDSGVFHSSFMLSDRRDSLLLDGIGTIRLLKPQASAIGGTLCPNACDSMRLVLHSNGNDPLTIDAIRGATMLFPPLPLTIPARTDTEIVVQYCNVGTSSDTVRFVSNADSSGQTIIGLTSLHITFDVTGKTSYGPLCLTESDSGTITITRTGNDVLSFDSVRTPSGILNASAAARGTDTLSFFVHYAPTVAGTTTDSIVVFTHSGDCDSVITIRLVGSANTVTPQFASTVLDFGSVEMGACVDSSIRISLPCGSDTVTLSGIAAPFTLIQPADGKVVLTRDSSTDIVIRYCATAVGRDSLVFTARDNGPDVPITLLGKGTAQPTQAALHFTLERKAVQAGTLFTYQISIDTARDVVGIDSVHAILRYDPQLLEANSATSTLWSVSGTERKPGEFEIFAHGSSLLTNGPFASIQMLPFFAEKNSTSIALTDIETFGSSASGADTGNVVVADCSNLSGNIIVAGPYTLDRVFANPVSSSLDLDVTTGATGAIGLRVYDLTGAIALTKTTSEFSRGKHHLSIDVSTLPSGVYRLTLESLGWHDGTTFIVQH